MHRNRHREIGVYTQRDRDRQTDRDRQIDRGLETDEHRNIQT